MSSFKNKLNKVILENAAPTFNNLKLNHSDVTESDVVNQIVGLAPLLGLRYLGYEEGVASFSSYNKAAIVNFTQQLDDNDYVETYDISVAITDPMSKETDLTTDLDWDTTRESEFIEFFIDVAIDFSIVQYNDVYIDSDQGLGIDKPFTYPEEIDQYDSFEDDGYIHSDDKIGFSTVYPNETPLVVRLANAKSHSPYGKFVVTVHPNKENQILIQCNYSNQPSLEDVEKDLNLLNSANLIDGFNDEFEIIKTATYIDANQATTSAIYKTRTLKNALSIVESINDFSKHNFLNEITRVVKVNNRGKRRIKMQCRAGYKYDPTRKVCVKITGAEKAHSRIAHRQMARTKKALGDGYKTRIVRKVLRAKRFRKMMGL